MCKQPDSNGHLKVIFSLRCKENFHNSKFGAKGLSLQRLGRSFGTYPLPRIGPGRVEKLFGKNSKFGLLFSGVAGRPQAFYSALRIKSLSFMPNAEAKALATSIRTLTLPSSTELM
jgi:hypothetical protein